MEKSQSRSRKRCLYLATFDPTIGSTGTTTRGRLFLRHLVKRYDVCLIHLEMKHAESRDHALIERLEEVISVKSSKLAYFVFSQSLLRSAYRKLEEEEFDFIFADFEKAGLYGYLAARKYGVPYIYNTHNVEYLRYIDVARPNRLRYLFVPYMYLIERISTHNALLTIAISEPDARVFRKWTTPDRVLVLPCAFEEDEINPFYEDNKLDPPVILMVGNYKNSGNRDGALIAFREILPRVIQQVPSAVFRFVGKHLPSQIGHPNVQAPGFVDDLRAEYARASVVIAPIRIGGGIKIKVIEALAAGKHLITTEKGMEGIDSSGLKHVTVTGIGEFPAAIVESIRAGFGTTRENWKQVSERYGVRSSLYRLVERLEESLRR